MPFFIGRTLVSMVTTTAFLPPGGLIFIQKHCKKKLKCLFVIVLTLMHPVFFQSVNTLINYLSQYSFSHFNCRVKQGKCLSLFLQKYIDSGTETPSWR